MSVLKDAKHGKGKIICLNKKGETVAVFSDFEDPFSQAKMLSKHGTMENIFKAEDIYYGRREASEEMQDSAYFCKGAEAVRLRCNSELACEISEQEVAVLINGLAERNELGRTELLAWKSCEKDRKPEFWAKIQNNGQERLFVSYEALFRSIGITEALSDAFEKWKRLPAEKSRKARPAKGTASGPRPE